MVHPAIAGILLTPICPHVLSARPLVLPDSTVLRIKVPKGNTAKAFFDGSRVCQELGPEDSLVCVMSRHPVPFISANENTSDWFASLARCLHWNERIEQKRG